MRPEAPKHALSFEHAGHHFACWEGSARGAASAPRWMVSVDDADPVPAFAADEAGFDDTDRLVAHVREWYDRRGT